MNRIGVFDSGIGGLSELIELKKLLPNENFLYYGDSKDCPFGSKSDVELINITKSIVDYLLKNGCKIIVIACNTATTRCIKKLREFYPNTIFIGTEPAIKVACDKGFKNTIVLATPQTIKSKSVKKLIDDNKRDDQNIYLVPCDGLADAIEFQDNDKIHKILRDVLSDYKDKSIDSIVLGCTHYPFIKKEISEVIPNAVLIDGGEGVARETKRQLEQNGLLNTESVKGDVEIVGCRNVL